MTNAALDAGLEVLKGKIDQPTEATDWFEITQERINQFADATLDQQWIHVDPERAKAGPFGAPIAHGQLTMSILSFLPGGADIGIPALDGVKLGINYGWNKVRFPAPVPVGSHIRTRGCIKSVEPKGNMLEVINEMTCELKGSDKPVCVAQSVLRLVF